MIPTFKAAILISVISFSVVALDFAPDGVYITSGFKDSQINNRILICDYSEKFEDTYCRVIEESAKAQIQDQNIVVVQDASKKNELGLLTGREFGAGIGTPKSSGLLQEVQLTNASIEYKTLFSLEWRKIDANTSIVFPVIEKNSKVRLKLKGKTYKAVGATYQY